MNDDDFERLASDWPDGTPKSHDNAFTAWLDGAHSVMVTPHKQRKWEIQRRAELRKAQQPEQPQ